MSNPKTIKISVVDMKGIRSFCTETNKILDEKKLTVDGRLIYEKNERVYYVDTDEDIWVEYYSNNSVSTIYRGEGGVSHLPTDRRK